MSRGIVYHVGQRALRTLLPQIRLISGPDAPIDATRPHTICIDLVLDYSIYEVMRTKKQVCALLQSREAGIFYPWLEMGHLFEKM